VRPDHPIDAQRAAIERLRAWHEAPAIVGTGDAGQLYVRSGDGFTYAVALTGRVYLHYVSAICEGPRDYGATVAQAVNDEGGL
jgi:hypothetical protein